MRAFIEWRDDWLLGLEEVDEEHQDLVALVNRLAERYCCIGCRGIQAATLDEQAEITFLLESLGEHVRTHFEHEETSMRAVGYPDLGDHCSEHRTLLAEYAEFMREVDNQGLECLDDHTLRELKSWLIVHMASADRRFGEYYRDTVLGMPRRDDFARRWMRMALPD